MDLSQPPSYRSLDWLIERAPPAQAGWRGRLSTAGRILRRHPRRTAAIIMLGAILVGAVIFLLGSSASVHRSARPRSTALPQQGAPHIDAPFAAKAMRPLTRDQAVAWNATVPSSPEANPAAQAFVAPLGNATTYDRSLQCLTMAVYYEAGNEPDAGQRAVAQVVLNRVRHVAYPNTVCGVVFEGANRKTGCQFTFACDGSLTRLPAPASWRRAGLVATAALGGYVYAPAGLATHYHADYVVPYWAASLQKIGEIGSQVFYRWSGGWGRGGAFRVPYAGNEPAISTPFGVDTQATLAVAANAPPARIAVADRPVIIRADETPGAKPALADTAPPPPTARTVALGDRWIVPHGTVRAVPNE